MKFHAALTSVIIISNRFVQPHISHMNPSHRRQKIRTNVDHGKQNRHFNGNGNAIIFAN